MIGHEKLSIDLTRLFPSVQIVRIPKSGGVVDLDDSYRQIVSAQQVRGYFYGEPELPKEISGLSGRMVGLEGHLSPYSFQIGWETLTILRVGEGGCLFLLLLLEAIVVQSFNALLARAGTMLEEPTTLAISSMTQCHSTAQAHLHVEDVSERVRN